MKKSSAFLLALLSLMSYGLPDLMAGSAVALGPHNEMVASYGHTREIAKRRALDQARRKYGENVRILASSDIAGYCAIAKARHPNGNWVIGVSLGNPSATQADSLAIRLCRKAGGRNPQVISAFRG